MSPEPLGHRATLQFMGNFNLYVSHFARGAACTPNARDSNLCSPRGGSIGEVPTVKTNARFCGVTNWLRQR